jgi:hypothetical protein
MLKDIIEERQKIAREKCRQKGNYSGETKSGTCMAGFYTEEDVDLTISQTAQIVAREVRKEERERIYTELKKMSTVYETMDTMSALKMLQAKDFLSLEEELSAEVLSK